MAADVVPVPIIIIISGLVQKLFLSVGYYINSKDSSI